MNANPREPRNVKRLIADAERRIGKQHPETPPRGAVHDPRAGRTTIWARLWRRGGNGR